MDTPLLQQARGSFPGRLRLVLAVWADRGRGEQEASQAPPTPPHANNRDGEGSRLCRSFQKQRQGSQAGRLKPTPQC